MRDVRQAVLDELGRADGEDDDRHGRNRARRAPLHRADDEQDQQRKNQGADVDRVQRTRTRCAHGIRGVAAHLAIEVEIASLARFCMQRDEIRGCETKEARAGERKQELRTRQRCLAKTTGNASASATNA